jgi:hypothetical protein
MLFYEFRCCNMQPMIYKGVIETNKERLKHDKHKHK